MMGVVLMGAAAAAGAATPTPADGMPTPLTATPGDAERGRALVLDRRAGLCLLCHSGPAPLFPEPTQQGTVATSLAGTGSRWSEAQLRQRIVDSRQLDPDSLMPAFHRSSGLHRVGAAWAGRPIFDAQQVEDVVAFLKTLR